MTLREEVLKQAGLLTEMPMKATLEAQMDELKVSFLCFTVTVENNNKTINIKENSNKNYKKEIYDYILTSTKLSRPTGNFMVENDEINKIPINYNVEAFTNLSYDGMGEYEFDYSVNYKDAEGERIIKFIIGKLGKSVFIAEANNIIKDLSATSDKKKMQGIITFINKL